MSDLPATSSYLSPNPEDRILQLTREILNIIKQIVYYAVIKAFNVVVTKALDKRLRPNCYRPKFVNKDPSSNV